MHLDHIPPSVFIGATADESRLAFLLQKAAGSEPFRFFDVIRGDSRSGRVLFQKWAGGELVVLPQPFTTQQAAEDLIEVAHNARYDPPEPPTPQSQKGWEVGTGSYNLETAVVIRAAWVTDL